MASTSTALLLKGSLRSFPFALLRYSPLIGRLSSISRIGIGRICPRTGCLCCSYTGLALGSIHIPIFCASDLKPVGRDHAEVGIIALEIMPVSSRITHPALERDVMVCEIRAIVKHHGWSRFILVSHSYGSIISIHLLKSPLTAPLIGPVVLVDPVSFLPSIR
jgi:hypothetical protein